MAYVTSTNLCYHDIRCMSNVRYLWIDFADIYSTDCSNLQSTVQIYHLFLAAEKIAEIPARGRGWMRYSRLHKQYGASLWDGV